MHTSVLRSPLVLVAMLVLVAAPPVLARSGMHHSAKSRSLAAYFPAAHQYPKGYKALQVQQYTDPSLLFTNGNVALARRSHLVIGATQTAISQNYSVATIMIARFRTPAVARHFHAAVQSDVTPGGKQKSGTIRDLGSTGARYVTGGCASCGPGAPPLYQVFFARGSTFVEVGIQPSNQGLARHLAAVIDAKLKRGGLR